MEIRRSKVKPCLAISQNKKYFSLFLFVFFVFFFSLWENKHFTKSSYFTHLIKCTVFGRALWGVNTFSKRNRLPDLKSGFRKLALSIFWFSIINYGGNSSVLKIKIILFCSLFPSWLRLRQMATPLEIV